MLGMAAPRRLGQCLSTVETDGNTWNWPWKQHDCLTYFSKHIYCRYLCIFPSQIRGAKWHWTFRKNSQICPWNLSVLAWALRKGLTGLLRVPYGVTGGSARLDPTPDTWERCGISPAYQFPAKCPYGALLCLLSTLKDNWKRCAIELFWEQIA